MNVDAKKKKKKKSDGFFLLPLVVVLGLISTHPQMFANDNLEPEWVDEILKCDHSEES